MLPAATSVASVPVTSVAQARRVLGGGPAAGGEARRVEGGGVGVGPAMPAAAARPRRQDGCERGGADSQTRVPATAAAAGKAGEGRAGRRGGVAASARGLPQRPLTFARARRLGGQVGGCLAATMRWIGCRGGGRITQAKGAGRSRGGVPNHGVPAIRRGWKDQVAGASCGRAAGVAAGAVPRPACRAQRGCGGGGCAWYGTPPPFHCARAAPPAATLGVGGEEVKGRGGKKSIHTSPTAQAA